MQAVSKSPYVSRQLPFYLGLALLSLLSACGGGAVEDAQTTDVRHFQMALDGSPGDLDTLSAQPLFHMAPVLMETPDDVDMDGYGTSARRNPARHAVAAALRNTDTRRLTRRSLEALAAAPLPETVATPLATTSVVSTYTPAQIRAAYRLPALPVLGTALSANDAAWQGAGQTIYVIGARHNPNTVAELNAFNQRFGLPACTVQTIAVSAALPLKAAATTGCQISVVYSTAAAAMTATAPAYDAGWATEMALDVQWSHATAPLARIILIEAPDPSLNSLSGAIRLANAMGPGIVSMSFGTLEGSWTASVDSVFSGSNMTYLAATGDSGAAVSWPSVSSKVVAVGGTTLNYSGSGTRTETTWSGTGGGRSLYTPVPAYQSTAVPGMGSFASRGVADVAFNADPASGQFVATLAPGTSSVKWSSVGGTSLATPQWAGLFAIANSVRALSAKAAIGAPHDALYRQIASVPGTYASSFADIASGQNGTCATCASKLGYDTPTGLGTPNAANLVNVLAGAAVSAPAPTPAPTAPVVSAASITGVAGKALSFNLVATAANAMTYTLVNAPAGMSVSSSGLVSWASPVAGSYVVTGVATDSKTGLKGQALLTITISSAASTGLTITAPSVSGKVGKVLSGSITLSAPGASYINMTVKGAPAGMSFVSTGLAMTYSWTPSAAGTTTMTVSVSDSLGRSAQTNIVLSVTP